MALPHLAHAPPTDLPRQHGKQDNKPAETVQTIWAASRPVTGGKSTPSNNTMRAPAGARPKSGDTIQRDLLQLRGPARATIGIAEIERDRTSMRVNSFLAVKHSSWYLFCDITRDAYP